MKWAVSITSKSEGIRVDKWKQAQYDSGIYASLMGVTVGTQGQKPLARVPRPKWTSADALEWYLRWDKYQV